MYQKKLPEYFNCGILTSLKVFGSKWKPCIINAIATGARRPSEIHRAIPIATPRVLDMQLKELTDWGMLTKEYKNEGFPLYVEYSLTEFGESTLAIIKQMRQWGQANRGKVEERYHTMLQNNVEVDDVVYQE